MSRDPNATEYETPRSEPEIIPPGRAPAGETWIRVAGGEGNWRGFHRVYIGRPSKFGIFALSAAAILIVACVFFLVAGVLLVMIPIAAALAIVSIIAALLRGPSRS